MRQRRSPKKTCSGFTILEVTIVLGLTGLLLVGILSGTYSSINNQRYNDSVRSFAEYLRSMYSQVLNPESLGGGNSNKHAVLGKVIVFGNDYKNADENRKVYSATLIGSATIPEEATMGNFITELGNADVSLYCGQPINGTTGASTVSIYDPLWQAEINYANQKYFDQEVKSNEPFVGSVIIARSPNSGGIHTIFTTETYDLLHACQPDKVETGASQYDKIGKDLKDYAEHPSTATVKFEFTDVGFCIKSENSNTMREVRLLADGRNTSAVSTIEVDLGDNKCQ